ncbi:MAG: outer membrane protein assembly factor BamD [Alistipes sp.]
MKQTWLHLLCGALLLSLLTGCAGVNRILRSGNSDLIYSKAMELYAAEKWSRAVTLFEGVQHIYDATTRADSIAFFTARCKFKSRNYEAAAEQLDQFRRQFGRSVFIEDVEGMYALCYFYMSPGPTRDQTMTGHARVAINEFMSRYPKSERMDEFQKIDSILLQRQYDKTYNNAYTYYKIGRYKSAIIALRNALNEYPASNHREQIMYLTVVSSYKLASNSIESKRIDRYLSMLDSYYSFVEEFPASEHVKELERMGRHAKDFLDKNNKEKTE